MLKKAGYFTSVFLALICLASSAFGICASAEEQVPFEGYTYWEDISEERKSVYSRPMYEADFVIDSVSLGIEPLTQINDVCVGGGNIYILDNSSRIVILDSSYNFMSEINSITMQDGSLYDFTGSQSLYIHSDGTFMLCDTDHAQVIRVDQTGRAIDIYTLPDSPLIPDGFVFKPLKAVMDSHGYLYVLSDGSYYGALLYAPDKSFMGFYGANEVTTGIASTIQNIIDRVFPNNVKKSASERTLPYSFVDIVIDGNDFVYTATGKTDTYDRVGQIKKLNPGTGNNILDSEDVNFTDDAFNTTFNNGTQIEQDIVGLEVTDDGFVYCLESQFGRVYLYDRSCRMLTAFGGGLGEGEQVGTFSAANSLALNGADVLVSDKLKNSLTVFKINDFGKKVMGLIDITLDGEYLEARDGWREVIALDRNFQPAYNGIARAYLTEKNYKAAMDVAKEGYDRETYELAFEMYRKDLLKQNFWIFFAAVVVIVSGLVALRIIIRRKQLKVIRSRQLSLMFSTLIHPVNSFDLIKEKKQGSLVISAVLIALFYVTAVLQVLCGGFLFTYYDPENFNSLWVLIRSAGVVLLWIISNWMICTLMQGKGTMREICIVTSYSLLPIIIERFLRLIFTNVLLPSEAMFLNGFDAVAIGFTGILLIIGLMKIHDFSMSRLIGSSLLSVIWLAVLIFLIILVCMLVQQLGGFIVTVVLELIS